MKDKLFFMVALATILSSFAQTYQGTHTFGSVGIDLAQTSAIDAQGNVYSAGNLGSPAVFGNDNTTFLGGNADGYLAKYDPMGNPVWIKTFAGGFDDVVSDITISSGGDIFLTGYFQGSGPDSFDADPGPGVFTLSQVSPILSRDCFIIKLDNNGDFVWAKQISNPSGAGAQEDSFAIKVNDQGEVYVAGRFIFADFDPGAGTQTILTPTTGFEGFLLKLDANGDFVWVNHLKDSANAVRDIVIDPNGDIVAVGDFSGTIDVSGATASAVNLTSISGERDVFIVKYDAMGNHIWSQSIGGTDADFVNVIERAASGEYFIGGAFNGTMDINPDPVVIENVTSNGALDAYVLAINPDGSYNNHYTIGGNFNDNISDIDLNYNGKAVITGNFEDVVDFDNSTNTQTSTSLGNTDAFVLSIDPISFSYSSHFTFGGTGTTFKTRVAYNANLDQLSFLGGFTDTVDFDPLAGVDDKTTQGLDDIYLMQLTGSVLSTQSPTQDLSTTFYPNPAQDFIHLSSINGLKNLSISDINGRMLLETRFSGQNTEQKVSLENLNSGIYIISIESEVGRKVERLIIK